LQVLWRLTAFLAQPLFGHWRIRTHELDSGIESPGEVDCLAHGLGGCVRSIGADDDDRHIMPITTNTTIATCIQIQVGDTQPAYYQRDATRLRQGTSAQTPRGVLLHADNHPATGTPRVNYA